MTALLSFSLYALVSSITPGPANVLLFGLSSQNGFRKVLRFLLGVLSGFALVLIVSALLAAYGIAVSEEVQLVFKIIGAVFLLYLAVSLWRNARVTAPSDKAIPGFFLGLLVHITSIKAWLFPLLAFATFAQDSGVGIALVKAAIFFGAAVVSHVLWVALGAGAHSRLNPTTLLWINRGSAVCLVALIIFAVLA